MKERREKQSKNEESLIRPLVFATSRLGIGQELGKGRRASPPSGARFGDVELVYADGGKTVLGASFA